MPTTTQTVIIDFQADFSSVEDAVTILEKAGKVDAGLAAQFRKTNAEIKAQGNAFNKTAADSGKSVQQFYKLADLLKQFPKTGMNRFLLQVGNELAAAGLKADDFFTKTKKGPDESVPKIITLRQELKNVKDQMQQAALAGGVLGEEYKRLKLRAGQLDDTIKDVANDIANAGSDTRGIDNVVGSISALAGGFSAVQGAAALFGDESEDLQKALLRVNAAMALATGLQQIANATTKQGSLTRLADTVTTYGQVAAQRLYALVVGQSVGAMKLFKIALASTGIGLLIIGLVSLISNMGGASKATKQLKKDLEDLRLGTDAAREAIRNTGEITQALLEEQGAKPSQLTEGRIKDLKRELSVEKNGLDELAAKRKKIQDDLKKGSVGDVTSRIKSLEEIEKSEKESAVKIAEIQQSLRVSGINIRTQESDERKKAAEEKARLEKEAADKSQELNEKALEAARKQRALDFDDFKAGVELRLLAAEKGSEDELNLRKELLRAQLQIDLEAEDITLNQKRLLIQQFFKERKALEVQFNKELVSIGLADEKSRLEAQLSNLNLNEQDRLDIKIEFLQIAAAEEIISAEGNAAKIRAINAKLQADIVEAKIAAIRKAADEEARLQNASGGSRKRALENVESDARFATGVRVNAIKQLEDIQLSAIDREIKANRDAIAVKGSDERVLEIEYEELLDKRLQATETAEQKITRLIQDENTKRRDSDVIRIQSAVQGLQQIGDIISGIQENQNAVAEASISRQRNEIDILLEQGAITEKEAIKRRRQVDEQERAAKNKAAQQTKALAVFNAFLQIPQAYIAGLTAPPPVGGPIYAAVLAGLAAVQASIIASRPVPRFATGKKGNYRGLGQVGEAGAELIQRSDGSMEVATKPTITYLGPKDKVFTASETKIMMPQVNKDAMKVKEDKGINYDKLAKAMLAGQKDGPNTVVNIDREFISESVYNGLMKTNYWDRYYKS